eukprot:1027294-Pyramimonas_sp.AAC.1
MHGPGDNRYTAEQLQEWRRHTSGHFSEHWFEGNSAPGHWGTSHRYDPTSGHFLEHWFEGNSAPGRVAHVQSKLGTEASDRIDLDLLTGSRLI